MARHSTRLVRFLQSVGDHPLYVGIDVHKKTYSIALFSPEDGQIECYSCPACIKGMTAQLLSFDCSIAGIVYEAGPTGFSLARSLHLNGFPVTVVAPSRVPRGAAASAKTDRLDASRLATWLARGLLKAIAVPTLEQEGYRALVRRRKKLAEMQAKIKQKIKSFLLVTGIAEPDSISRWSLTAAKDLLALDLSSCHQRTLASMVREYKFLSAEEASLQKQIVQISKHLHGDSYSRLLSVAGVGEITATSFLAEIFSPERFNRPEEVTSYLGLAPVVCHSGQGQARAKLRAVGQRRLRSILIEAAWQWSCRDPQARDLFKRHLAKSGLGQKAICAVARHLAFKLWRLVVVNRQSVPSGG